MNRHDDIRNKLSAYCSGELSPAEREQLREHQASCPRCREELAGLETVLHLLRTTPEVEPPPWLTTRVMARVRDQQTGRSGWLQRLFLPLRIKLPIEAAALLVVCLTGWYLTRTVETELKQPLRSDVVEPAPPAAQPANAKPAAEQPAAGGRRAEPSPPPSHLEQGITPKQPASPQPPPSPATPSAAPSDASPPWLEKKTLPMPAAPPAAQQPVPAAESPERLKDTAPGTAGRAFKGAPRSETESHVPAPAARGGGKQNLLSPPAVTLRLETDNPAAAPAAIRDAAERSGGYVVDERAVPDRRITVSVPARRFSEFQQRLNRFGRVPVAPQIDPESGMLAVTISW